MQKNERTLSKAQSKQQVNCTTSKRKVNQTDRVLDYMIKHGRITSMDAFRDLGITRLSARIWDLRHRGNAIATVNESSKNRYGDITSYCVYRYIP